MSHEIVPFMEGSETATVHTEIDSNMMRCRAQGLGFKRDMPCYDLFLPRNTEMVDLIGRNHQMRHFRSPKMGQKSATQLNPTFASVEHLLAKIKEPSVLCLRGCDSLLRSDFPFDQFRSLTSLEISDSTHLTTLPEKQISEMTQLQTLNLSHLPIKELPHDLFSKLTSLRSLIIRGCSGLQSLPDTPDLCALEYLELSDLLIATIPDGFFVSLRKLRWVIVTGCSKLGSLPSTDDLEKLEVLDLSHCTALQEMVCNALDHPHLKMLDLSYTALSMIPQIIRSDSLTHIFLRETKLLDIFNPIRITSYTLKVLDLSGAQNPFSGSVDEFFLRCLKLVVLDLSRTAIKSLKYSIHTLRELKLRECTVLVTLPKMNKMRELEVLDVSGCEILADLPEDLSNLSKLKELNLSGCSSLRDLREGLFDNMSCLEKLDLSKTNLKRLPSFANLTNLQTLNLSQTSLEKLPNLSHLVSLKEFVPPECHEIDFTGAHSKSGMRNLQEEVSPNPSEFHLVSTFISDSGFDRFKYEFNKLDNLISNIEKSIQPTKSNFSADLKYILEKIDLLETSRNCSISEELLLELVSVANSFSVDDFLLDGSTNFNEFVRVVAKLKLLVPPPPKIVNEEGEEEEKKKKARFTKIKAEEHVDSNSEKEGFSDGHDSFESLTNIQRNCLLYFAVFPFTGMWLEFKESMLIQLWYGEGFIDPTTNSNSSPEICKTGTTGTEVISLSKGVPSINDTVKEMGQRVLEVLAEKKFIERWVRGRCNMNEKAHNFVNERAKEVRFFNFDESNGELTPQLLGSQRACLLKSQVLGSSSCKLWLNYTTSVEKLKSLNEIHTLLYVNEPVTDINTEWFSNMRNLLVLHLGNLSRNDENMNEVFEQIDVVDLKFLEELKNMKQLRLLSLEGLAALRKLPISFCKVTNLRMLNLGCCTNLEELPAGIGSLQNLTHLDLTECHLLSDLPKGLRLLSSLEVLKGFVITYQPGGRQHTKACTLRELLKLKKLRKLNLVVNKDKFPNSEDLEVFKQMKNLCNLSITWIRNYDEQQEEPNEQEALRQSRWQQLKCWKQQTRQSEIEELPTRSRLENLRKLVFRCFPLETAPNWVHQGELQKLAKLYILGGNLKTLPGDTNQNAWNSIETVKLSYLPNLEVDRKIAKQIFTNLRPKIYKCGGARLKS